MLYVITIISGIVLALQNPFSVNLGRKLGSPLLSTFTTYIVGTIELLLLLLILRMNVANVLTETFTHGFPWFLGGIFGAIYITSVIILFPRLGPIKAVIYPTLGQVISGILIDTFGWFKMPMIPMTTVKLIGLVLLIVGVLLSAYQPKSKRQANEKSQIIEPIWAFVAGVLSTIQSTFNGNLGVQLNSAVGSTFIAFLLSAVLLTAAVLVKRELTFSIFKTGVTSLLAWVTTTMGAVFVLCMAFLTPKLGPGLTISLSLIATMIGSAVIEHFGWFAVMKNRITRLKVISMLIFVIGIIFIKVLN